MDFPEIGVIVLIGVVFVFGIFASGHAQAPIIEQPPGVLAVPDGSPAPAPSNDTAAPQCAADNATRDCGP